MYSIPDLPHLYSEGIDYVKRSYPDGLVHGAHELGKQPESFEGVNPQESTLTLYRGVSGKQLEERGIDPEEGDIPEKVQKDDFAFYFTTSREHAEDHARREESSKMFLMEIEVGFDDIDEIVEYNPFEVANKYEQLDLDVGNVYFNQEVSTWDSLEFVAESIPREWIEDIEEIEY